MWDKMKNVAITTLALIFSLIIVAFNCWASRAASIYSSGNV